MWPLAHIGVIASKTMVGFPQHPVVPSPELDRLMLFGFISAGLTLLFFKEQRQSRSAVLALAVCLLATAVYGFLEGAWPLGMIQSVWSVSIFRRWRSQRHFRLGKRTRQTVSLPPPGDLRLESRISRMFGSMSSES